MSHRYEFTRAAGEKSLMLIFAEGAFECLPFEIRLHARWTGSGYGKMSDLKPADRRALLGAGYAIVREAASDVIEQTFCMDDANIGADTGLRRAA